MTCLTVKSRILNFTAVLKLTHSDIIYYIKTDLNYLVNTPSYISKDNVNTIWQNYMNAVLTNSVNTSFYTPRAGKKLY